MTKQRLWGNEEDMHFTEQVLEMTMNRVHAEGSRQASRRPFRVRVVHLAIPLAVCFVIALVLTLPQMLDHRLAEDVTRPSTDIDGSATSYVATLDQITGLPTGDYTWDGSNNSMSAARVMTNDLRSLMYCFGDYDTSVMASFAVVRVSSVQSFEEDVVTGQIADCSVLYPVLGDGIDKSLQLKQYQYSVYTSIDAVTNLLRVGGVYVLPLAKFPEEDMWGIYGDMDCLFEVDEKGLLHSHSQWEDLNKYDGKPLETLWSDIEYLCDNRILCSRFADRMVEGCVVETAGDIVKLVQPENGWDEADAKAFSAKIDADGKIVIETDGFNVFRPFEGLTLDHVGAAIKQIEQYSGVQFTK